MNDRVAPTVFDSNPFDLGISDLSILELSGPEHLLVWATRKCAFRCGTAGLVDLEFRRACGDRLGREVAAAFRDFLRLLARQARRPLALGPPGWFGATHDEHRLLQLFAAAQAQAEDRMRMHLVWFLPAAATREAQPPVSFIAAALRDHGHRLSPTQSSEIRDPHPPAARLDESTESDIFGFKNGSHSH